MFTKILVALDSSTTADKVFQQALDLAKAMQAELMLLHILSADEQDYPVLPTLPSPYYYSKFAEHPFDLHQQAWRSYEQKGIERLKDYARRATNVGLTVDYQQSFGVPGQIICDTAGSWDADLIMVGCRGRAGLSELLLGSVSNYVTHHAPCTVMVIRAFDQESMEPVHNQHPEQVLAHLAGWQ